MFSSKIHTFFTSISNIQNLYSAESLRSILQYEGDGTRSVQKEGPASGAYSLKGGQMWYKS